MLANVLKNFGSLTTMRVLSRIIQFIIKTYLIRTELNEEVLAHMLHLQLILTTSLHVARSCFKPSYQKVQNPTNIIKSSMNIMTLGVFATIISTAVVASMEYFQFISSGKTLTNFANSIALYAAAAVCEAVAEKYMVECVIKYEYFKIGLIEVISIAPKTIFIFSAVFLQWFSEMGILVFGIGQFFYSFTLMIIFYLVSSNKSLLFQKIQHNNEQLYLDPKSKSSLKAFSLLSFLKLILQQFQNIVLVVMDISHISSIYSLINNLGSIVVRYLFSPLNEIIFNHFSRGKEEDSVTALESFIKFISYFAILILSFGYNYSQTFLVFLYGQKWATQQSILAMRTYMALLIFLGLNGVIEAFLFAKGKESLTKYNFMSIILTGIYLASTIFFLQLGYGAAGLFLGNIINMTSRIIVCWYLEIQFHISITTLLSKARPSALFLLVSIAIFITCHHEYGFALHLFEKTLFKMAFGVLFFGLNLTPILFENRLWIIKQIKERLLKKKGE